MRVVGFPDEWGTLVRAERDERGIHYLGLSDGTTVYALSHPKGARFVRITPSLEERYSGEPPTDPEFDVLWRELLGAVVESAHEVAQEMTDAGLGEHVPKRYREPAS